MSSTAGFWTSAAVSPKRKFRFLVRIGSMPNGAKWYAKSVDKPVVTVATANHKFLNHTFYYPGSVTWNEINVELVTQLAPMLQSTCHAFFLIRVIVHLPMLTTVPLFPRMKLLMLSSR